MRNKRKHDVAQFVRDAIAHSPPYEYMRLDVDEVGIIATEVGGKTWWREPVIPSPMPRRRTAMYEAFAEIEGYLQDERGLDILLFAGDFENAGKSEPVMK